MFVHLASIKEYMTGIFNSFFLSFRVTQEYNCILKIRNKFLKCTDFLCGNI